MSDGPADAVTETIATYDARTGRAYVGEAKTGARRVVYVGSGRRSDPLGGDLAATSDGWHPTGLLTIPRD